MTVRRWKAPTAVVAVGLSLGLAPLATGAVASASVPGRVRAVQQISRDPLNVAGFESGTEVEPDVAIDPNDPSVVVAAVQQSRTPEGGAAAIGYAWSHDGGLTWHHATLPGLTKATGGQWNVASDPVVAIGADGSVYVQTLAVLQNATHCANAILVQRSTDHGVTFGAPVAVQRDHCDFFNDKDWITVDTAAGSPHRGRVYSMWDRSSPSVPFVFPTLERWSDDGGVTWSRPVDVTGSASDTIGSQPVVEPDGSLVVVYLSYIDQETRAFVVAQTSTDGGATFSSPVTLHESRPYLESDMRTGDMPSATVDPVTGRVYVVAEDNHLRSDGLNDILLNTSDDHGSTWSAGRRVNRDAVDSMVNHFTPDVAARGGEVMVTFRTRDHADGASPRVLQRYVVSTDGGARFGAPQALGPASDLAFAATSPVPFFGDYEGSAASAKGFVAVWDVSRPTSGSSFNQTTWAATISG